MTVGHTACRLELDSLHVNRVTGVVGDGELGQGVTAGQPELSAMFQR